MTSSNDIADDLRDTPPQRAKKSATISSKQKKRVDELDGGRCFVTYYRDPGINIQSAHILASAATPSVLRELEIKWGAKAHELNVGTRRNVIRLRCDWHAMFDENHWALVPADYHLHEIISRYSVAVSKKKDVSPTLPDMLEAGATYDYHIVFFPPLAKHVYHRATNDDQTEFEQIAVPNTGISEVLSHHSHPYFAIQNALPKFNKYEATLTKEQEDLHDLLKKIVKAWDNYYSQVAPKRSRPAKHGGANGNGDDPSGPDSMDNPGNNGDDPGSRSKRPRIAEGPEDSSGGGGQSSTRAMEGTDDPRRTSQLQNLPPTPPISPPRNESAKKACYSDWGHVASWLDSVSGECEPVTEQALEWPVDEASRPVPSRKPMVQYEWSIPPDKSKFSSTDWAMYIMGAALERSLSPPQYSD